MSAPRSPFGGPKTWNTRSDFRNIVANVTRRTRSPLPTDKDYPVGQLWVNVSARQAYILVALQGGEAFWKLAAVNETDLESLTGDTGGPVFPDPVNLNINVVGAPFSGITVTGDPGSHSLLISAAFSGVTGSAQTTGDETQTLITLPIALGTTVTAQGLITGHEASDSLGGLLSATAYNTSGSAVLVTTDSISYAVPSALEGATFEVSVSGANMIFEVTGTPEGGNTKVIDWTGNVTFNVAGP